MSGHLVLVVGPSGAGKDTLIAASRGLVSPDTLFVRRLVTRAGTDFEDNDTISEEAFEAGVNAGQFALHWRAHGHAYALPDTVQTALSAGKTVVANVSRGVVAEARRRFSRVTAVSVDAPESIRAARLTGRQRPSDGAISARLARATRTFDEPFQPDVTITNLADPLIGGAFLAAAIRGDGIPFVVSTSRDDSHRFSKVAVPEIRLIEGEGVEGDAHRGVTVKHRSRVKVDPTQPNLRQVHLIPAELLMELAGKGFVLAPASLGENLLTFGLDCLALPRDTCLRIGSTACLRVTGLRNPCAQIESFRPGLLAQVLDKDEAGNLVRKAGVMSVVVAGGTVAIGDGISVEMPLSPLLPLDRV